MDKKYTIFLTGATGLLGSYLLKLFLGNDHKVYVLARSKKDKSAKERVYDYVRFWDESPLPPFLAYHCEQSEAISENASTSRRGQGEGSFSSFAGSTGESRICYTEKRNGPRSRQTKSESTKGTKEHLLTIVEGDITFPQLGIKSKKLQDELTSEIEVIYHSAALAKLRAPWDIIYKINVEGTKNVFDFALQCQKKGNLKKVNHISTAYVAGTAGDIDFTEDMFDLGQGFNNVYEQTKYEAECLVREFQKTNAIPIAIFRPSLVMGDSKEGKTTDFHLFYEPLRFFNQELFNEFPIDRNLNENLINIDTVGNAMYLLGEDIDDSVYHITSPENTNVGFFMDLASEYFGFKLPRLIELNKFSFDNWTPVQKVLAEPFIPYFNYKTRFISEKTQSILKKKDFLCPKIDGQNFTEIFAYCRKRDFIS
ncbi:MAG: SDR family oxidoreductase [bacterium]